MPQTNARALDSRQAFMARVASMDVAACPVCKAGRLRMVGIVLGMLQLPEPGTSVLPCNRGPPP